MTTLRDIGEFGIIDRIAQMAGAPPEAVCQGIGDDCVVLDVGGPEKLLATTDAALESRHFDLAWMTPFEAAQRSVAGALSDIAAMGGRPFLSLCTSVLPQSDEAQEALELLRGVAETARRYGAPLVGGDTISGINHYLIDLVVLGWAERPWLRSGAHPGDRLLVTGSLGGAATALGLALNEPARLKEPRFSELRSRLVDPTPRLAEAAILARTGFVHAAIDISDGLYQDAGHIARESDVHLSLEAAKFPVPEAALVAGELLPLRAPWWAATSGEEYELLLAVDPECVGLLTSLLQEHGLAPLTEIGTVRQGEGVSIVREDGSEVEMERGGWDHFRPPTTWPS